MTFLMDQVRVPSEVFAGLGAKGVFLGCDSGFIASGDALRTTEDLSGLLRHANPGAALLVDNCQNSYVCGASNKV